jgi:hypothetical protein
MIGSGVEPGVLGSTDPAAGRIPTTGAAPIERNRRRAFQLFVVRGRNRPYGSGTVAQPTPAIDEERGESATNSVENGRRIDR